MTTRLAQALHDAAEAAPPVPPAQELWRRGRRRRRRRRTTAALACLLVVAALAFSPPWGRPGPELAGADAAVLPATADRPYLWQRTLQGDPNGPVKLAFRTGHSLNLESALVLVGRDDSYRIDYLAPGEEAGVLSPDGRWLLGENLLDLATGETRELDRPLSAYVPAVWAPDGRTAVGIISPDNGETSYGSDGEELAGLADEIVLVDVASGAVRTIGTVPDARRWRAAFSPDGRRLAMNTARTDEGSSLIIQDPSSGEPPREVKLDGRQWLAGPAAWTPDGTGLLLVAGDRCAWADQCADQTWHVRRLDVATGAVVDEPAGGGSGTPVVVAWRDGEPVVQQHHAGRSCEIVALTTAGVRALPLSVDGTGCADYARDLLEEGRLGGAGIGPAVWQAQWWAYASLVLLGAALALALRRVLRRRRSAAAAA